MVNAAPITSGLLALAGGAVLVVLHARLARAAHRAEDLGESDASWVPVAGAATLFGLAALLRAARGFADGPPLVAETVLVLLVEGSGAVLLIRYFQSAHLSRHGAPPEGTVATGLLLVGTGVAATLLLARAPTPDRLWSLGNGIGAGLVAWAFTVAAAFVEKTGREPAWVPGFAAAGAQVLVLTTFANALVLNAALAGGSFDPIRPVHHAGILLGVALAAPCLAAASNSLLKGLPKREHSPSPQADAPQGL